MGSYDGAEICDLIGLFLLSELQKLNLNIEFGCYKDDGLAISRSSARQNEKTVKKKISDTYNKYGLEITIQTNKKSVQFLDVEFNLENYTYKSFLKPGENPLYVVYQHQQQPPTLIF